MVYNRVNWEDGEKIADGYVTINGQNYPTVEPVYQGQTATSADNLNVMDEGISNLYPEILYQNEEGVNTNITLNNSVENYSFIEVFYRNNDNYYTSRKFYKPNNKKIILDSNYISPTNIVWKYQHRLFENDKFNVVQNTELSKSDFPNVTNNSNIYVFLVLGYK